MSLAPDLRENLARADGFERVVLNMIDGFIHQTGLDAPAEQVPQLRDGYKQAVVEELDLQAAGINTIIWATGYRLDFSFVKLPVCDANGMPVQTRGVSPYPGLYFVGLAWTPNLKAATLAGVRASTEHIARTIAQAYAYS